MIDNLQLGAGTGDNLSIRIDIMRPNRGAWPPQSIDKHR
jgi:hypothetical protein